MYIYISYDTVEKRVSVAMWLLVCRQCNHQIKSVTLIQVYFCFVTDIELSLFINIPNSSMCVCACVRVYYAFEVTSCCVNLFLNYFLLVALFVVHNITFFTDREVANITRNNINICFWCIIRCLVLLIMVSVVLYMLTTIWILSSKNKTKKPQTLSILFIFAFFIGHTTGH